MAVPILMYHSISNAGPGPVSLSPDVFRDQLAVLADAGAECITLSAYVEAVQSGRALDAGTVVLTFDDGYRDFADVACQALQAHGWSGTVFVPIRPLDACTPWDCGDGFARDMLSWDVVTDLAAAGVEMGAHSMTHRDLTTLAPSVALDEIVRSREQLEQRIGRRVAGFAPPFGRITAPLRQALSAHYVWCAGARMGRAHAGSDRYHLPRIEMWYFRNIRRWQQYVSRGWTTYFGVRAALRAVKERL